MCTLALFRNVSSRYPVVVAANRDEFYSRPTTPPLRLPDRPLVLAGRDLEAGGTWLGWRVEEPFLVAGILNRRSAEASLSPSPPGPRSRGLLVLDALQCTSASDAADRFGGRFLSSYGPFNLVVADRNRALVVSNTGDAPVTELADGLTILTNLEINDARCPRLATARVEFDRIRDLLAGNPPLATLIEVIAMALGNHENAVDPDHPSPLARLCVHTEGYGTRSATVIVAEAGTGVRAFHAAGPPCSNPLLETTP